jgi:nucleoside diphosphate kinase
MIYHSQAAAGWSFLIVPTATASRSKALKEIIDRLELRGLQLFKGRRESFHLEPRFVVAVTANLSPLYDKSEVIRMLTMEAVAVIIIHGQEVQMVLDELVGDRNIVGSIRRDMRLTNDDVVVVHPSNLEAFHVEALIKQLFGDILPKQLSAPPQG